MSEAGCNFDCVCSPFPDFWCLAKKSLTTGLEFACVEQWNKIPKIHMFLTNLPSFAACQTGYQNGFRWSQEAR